MTNAVTNSSSVSTSKIESGDLLMFNHESSVLQNSYLGVVGTDFLRDIDFNDIDVDVYDGRGDTFLPTMVPVRGQNDLPENFQQRCVFQLDLSEKGRNEEMRTVKYGSVVTLRHQQSYKYLCGSKTYEQDTEFFKVSISFFVDGHVSNTFLLRGVKFLVSRVKENKTWALSHPFLDT
eukprot:CAMPEP_0115010640 /NCGR_PEP_ID=MMETSP0216-20121206/23444_1 /TAXON_ID=223996 /ORGANISM="Protocruzia adherens, Strain Boccale" /LENGTH=176 /DNA_ID=CAMNT_0002378909 /DNA_START=441 /DNA_END=971 /DNA_ORIENTATION=+